MREKKKKLTHPEREKTWEEWQGRTKGKNNNNNLHTAALHKHTHTETRV